MAVWLPRIMVAPLHLALQELQPALARTQHIDVLHQGRGTRSHITSWRLGAVDTMSLAIK